MLLLIDCKYKLVHKSPSHSSSKGPVLKVQLTEGSAVLEEHVELILADTKSGAEQDQEPTKPLVSHFDPSIVSL